MIYLRPNLHNRIYQSSDILLEGFGKNVEGYTGSTVHTVTSPDVSGAGTLSNILLNYHDDYRIEFAENITEIPIFDNSPHWIRNNVTIDGFANGHPNGVVIRWRRWNNGLPEIRIHGGGTDSTTGNILIRGLCLVGNNPNTAQDTTQADLITIIPGKNGGRETISGVLIYGCSFTRSNDGSIDMACDTGLNGTYGAMHSHIENVTVQHCLFDESGSTMLIKMGHHRNISIHHNLWLAGSERQPQICGEIGPVDVVNNIYVCNCAAAGYPWDFTTHAWNGDWNWNTIPNPCPPYPDPPYTNSITVQPKYSTLPSSPGNPTVNVIGNAMLGDRAQGSYALDAGVPTSARANTYVAPHGLGADNNYWGGCTVNRPAGIASALIDIPAEYRITRHSIVDLKNQIPLMGCVRVDTNADHVQAALDCYPV